MRTVLERTYGFDQDITYPGVALQGVSKWAGYRGYLPQTIFEFVADAMQIPVIEVIDERVRTDDGDIWCTIAKRKMLNQGQTESAYGSLDFRRHDRNLRITIAETLLRFWKGDEDGYTAYDYEQFVHRVAQQVEHILESWDGRGKVPASDFSRLFWGIFGHRSSVYHTVMTWRYVALRIMETPNTAVMLPKTAAVDYGVLATSLDDLTERGRAASKKLSLKRDDVPSAYDASLQVLFDTPTVNATTGNMEKQRNFGLFRHIELNEFFQHGAAEQTLEDFLTNTPWLEERVTALVVQDYGDTTAALNQDILSIQHLPFFLRLHDMRNMPVGVQKMLLALTRDQLYEIYTNPRKRPEIVRTDAKSRTKKYVEEFLQDFFEDGDDLGKYDTTRDDCDTKMLQLILSGDMQSYLVARQYRPGNHVVSFSSPTGGSAQNLLLEFLEDVSIADIFFKANIRSVFQVLYQHGGFDNRNMVDMMLIAYCFSTPKLFAWDTGSAQDALTLLANAVLREDMTADAAVSFIVDAAKHSRDVVPLVNEDALETIAQHAGTTPAEWYMPLLTLQKRQVKGTLIFERLRHPG